MLEGISRGCRSLDKTLNPAYLVAEFESFDFRVGSAPRAGVSSGWAFHSVTAHKGFFGSFFALKLFNPPFALTSKRMHSSIFKS